MGEAPLRQSWIPGRGLVGILGGGAQQPRAANFHPRPPAHPHGPRNSRDLAAEARTSSECIHRTVWALKLPCSEVGSVVVKLVLKSNRSQARCRFGEESSRGIVDVVPGRTD